MIAQHRRELVAANLIAILGALAAVPVPLLIPLLVDEVLLQQPGNAVEFMNSLFPRSWHGPILYISAITLLTLGIGCVQVGTDEVGVKTVYLSATGDTGVKEASYGTGYHMYVPPLVGFTVLKKTEQKL